MTQGWKCFLMGLGAGIAAALVGMQLWSVALSAAIAANSQPTLLRPLTSARTWELREDSPDSLPRPCSRKSSRTSIRTGELSL